MDKTDVLILRELTQAQSVLPARPGLGSSFRSIARRLGVSPGTVRNRINSMYSSGVLTGSSVYPNPNLLDLKAGAYAIDVSPGISKREAVERLKLIDGVMFIQNFHGSLVGLGFAYEDDSSLRKKLALINSIAGTKEGGFSRVHYPPCKAELTLPDWRLVARLTKGGFTDYNGLAAELGISPRTLKRKLSKIVSGNAIMSVPTLDYTAINGAVLADFIVLFTTKESRAEAERRIAEMTRDFLIYGGSWEDFAMYSLVLPKLVAIAKLEESIRKVHGVKTVRAEPVDEHIDLAGSLGEHLERHMAIMERTRNP